MASKTASPIGGLLTTQQPHKFLVTDIGFLQLHIDHNNAQKMGSLRTCEAPLSDMECLWLALVAHQSTGNARVTSPSADR